jgi:hypothetical protein
MISAEKLAKMKSMVVPVQGQAQPAQPMPGPAQAGIPNPQGADPGKPRPYGEVNAEIDAMMQSNPQMVEQLKTQIMQLMQSGELTAQELNMAVQLSRAALQDPKLYPQLRQFAIQQGIGTEQDLPQEFDQGLLISIVIAGRAMDAGAGNPGQVMPSMKEGGALPSKSANQDGSIPIEAHEGEYVIPADVVKYYGTKFLDGLKEKMEKANEPAGGNGA